MAEDELCASLRRIADTVETNGGWHIAALKVRAAADEIERLNHGNDTLRDELGVADALVESAQADVERLRAALDDAARPEASPYWVPRSWHDAMMRNQSELLKAHPLMLYDAETGTIKPFVPADETKAVRNHPDYDPVCPNGHRCTKDSKGMWQCILCDWHETTTATEENP